MDVPVTEIPNSTPDDLIWHVVPVDDIREHDDHLCRGKCWCRPEIIEDGINYIVVHNSADGREAYETGQRKLN
ncbi:MAG: hypothetical protein Q7S17_02105 [Xanthobacteraceae bacterium]|nr:hypothetical protein [Xanthobacteraceae bacterium]